jgi:23S rRNA pseudouridine2605 synthase
LDKTYHVQVNSLAGEVLSQKLAGGISTGGELLRAKRARVLRVGEKNTWLEIVLDEGRNRQIRRMFDQMEIEVLRLVRIAIGPINLGDLAKGQLRELSTAEKNALRRI